MKKTATLLFMVLVLNAVIFAGGTSENVTEEMEDLKVVATTSIIGDVVKQVIQDNGELTVLMPVGQNPHSYTPTPRDIATMESADIIFINGLDLEEELIPIIESLNGPLVVEVSRRLTAEKEDENHDDHKETHQHAGNPHFWFSPIKVIHWVHEIEEALGEFAPEHAESYHKAAEAYEAQLMTLDTEIRNLIESVPAKDRKLVMDHKAFEYFADDYGFKILANLLPGMSDQAEPSARHITEVINIVEEYEIRALFVGGTAGQSVIKLAEAVAAETNRPLPVVGLLTGSLASKGRGTDYLDFIRYNTEQIVEALVR